MKIRYIWVDNFRNFKDFGFNLSSEYKFTYDVEENFISLKKENSLPAEFFGERIIDVIGIIGKNGAGKSNAIELLCKILKGSKTTMKSDFFIIVEVESLLACYWSFSNKNFPNADFEVQIESYTGSVSPLKVVYFSNVFDERKSEFNREVADISINKLFSRNSLYREKGISTFEKQIKFINSNAFSSLNIELPTRVQLTSKIWISKFNHSIERNIYGKALENIRQFKKLFRERLRELKTENKFVHLIRFGYFFDVIDKVARNRNSKTEKYWNSFEDEFANFLYTLFSLKTEEISENLLSFLERNLLILFSEQKKETLKESDQIEYIDNYENALKQINFLKDIKSLLINVSILNNVEGSRSNEIEYFTFNYMLKNSKDFINQYISLFGQNNFFEINWIGISSGHKAYLNLFSSIYQEIRFTKSYNLLICIDEGDLYLHPLWQTEFFDKLITVLPKIYQGDIQLVLTSHSPFLLSDLPNQNITILDKDAPGSTIDAINLKIKTFGVNLYELYSEPFFLGTKRTSDFAYNKIKDLISKLENKNISDNEKEDIIKLTKLIGDEIIRYRINKLLSND